MLSHRFGVRPQKNGAMSANGRVLQPNNKTAANPIQRWPIGDELLAKSGGALISPSGMGVFFPKGHSCMISAHAPDRLVVSPKGATIDTSPVLRQCQ